MQAFSRYFRPQSDYLLLFFVCQIYFVDTFVDSGMVERYGKEGCKALFLFRISTSNGTLNPTVQAETSAYEEIRCLRKELAEAQKENDFLKKAVAFFARGQG